MKIFDLITGQEVCRLGKLDSKYFLCEKNELLNSEREIIRLYIQ